MIPTRTFLLQTFVVATYAAFGIATLHAQSIPSIDNCKAAAEYSHSQHGTGVLVMVLGEIVFEDYAPGWTADKPHLLASGTKSFCGVMAGLVYRIRPLEPTATLAASSPDFSDRRLL